MLLSINYCSTSVECYSLSSSEMKNKCRIGRRKKVKTGPHHECVISLRLIMHICFETQFNLSLLVPIILADLGQDVWRSCKYKGAGRILKFIPNLRTGFKSHLYFYEVFTKQFRSNIFILSFIFLNGAYYIFNVFCSLPIQTLTALKLRTQGRLSCLRFVRANIHYIFN